MPKISRPIGTCRVAIRLYISTRPEVDGVLWPTSRDNVLNFHPSIGSFDAASVSQWPAAKFCEAFCARVESSDDSYVCPGCGRVPPLHFGEDDRWRVACRRHCDVSEVPGAPGGIMSAPVYRVVACFGACCLEYYLAYDSMRQLLEDMQHWAGDQSKAKHVHASVDVIEQWAAANLPPSRQKSEPEGGMAEKLRARLLQIREMSAHYDPALLDKYDMRRRMSTEDKEAARQREVDEALLHFECAVKRSIKAAATSDVNALKACLDGRTDPRMLKILERAGKGDVGRAAIEGNRARLRKAMDEGPPTVSMEWLRREYACARAAAECGNWAVVRALVSAVIVNPHVRRARLLSRYQVEASQLGEKLAALRDVGRERAEARDNRPLTMG